ncbi:MULTISPECIES: TolC family protein [Acinetobacter calcoaceticus/baumannii complex]|uniref:TolC family protein n=1 Tax=Acinetobacter calcoaceticus/baumannii complex TaxID=909768 RepID=UPI00344F1ECF
MNKMSQLVYGLCCISMGLSGCQVIQPYQSPTQETPITLVSPEVNLLQNSNLLHAETAWWEIFNDKQLNGLIELSLKNNHDIQAAYQRLLAARAIVREQELNELPQVTTGANYQQSKQQQLNNQGNTERRTSRSTQIGFDMQWELDLFGRLQHLTQSAIAQSQARAAYLRQIQLSVIADTARNYFELCSTQQQIGLIQEEIDSWQKTLDIQQSKLALGRGNPEEIETTQSYLYQAQAQLPALDAERQRLRYRLDILTGQDIGQNQQLLAADKQPVLFQQISLGDINHLIMQRPDVVEAERLYAAQYEQVGAVKAELYPKVQLGGFLGFFALRGGDLGTNSQSYRLMPSLSWPALHLGSVKARVNATQAETQHAEILYRQKVLLAQEEVENAITAFIHSQNQQKLLVQAGHAAQTALNITQKKYQIGTVSYVNVLDNQRQLNNLKQQISLSENDSFLQLIKIYKALGVGIT